MATSYSPLRYPGGKQILARVLGHLISLNGRSGGIYVEPYAGGAGAALALLLGGHVNRILINDADSRVFAFWKTLLNDTDRFVSLLRSRPLSVDEWRRQRRIYLKPDRYSTLSVGFATFYLNRCNRSGIIANAGIIGGLKQTGRWKLDARFNRKDLEQRILRIARYGDRIGASGEDAVKFLKRLGADSSTMRKAFVYLDPPYYDKGSQLYMNHYTHSEHQSLSEYLRSTAKFVWVMSYDNIAPIRALYSEMRQVKFNLGYSARKWRIGNELLIFGQALRFPSKWRQSIPDAYISAADHVAIPMEANS